METVFCYTKRKAKYFTYKKQGIIFFSLKKSCSVSFFKEQNVKFFSLRKGKNSFPSLKKRNKFLFLLREKTSRNDFLFSKWRSKRFFQRKNNKTFFFFLLKVIKKKWKSLVNLLVVLFSVTAWEGVQKMHLHRTRILYKLAFGRRPGNLPLVVILDDPPEVSFQLKKKKQKKNAKLLHWGPLGSRRHWQFFSPFWKREFFS